MCYLITLIIGALGVASFVSEISTFILNHRFELWRKSMIHRAHSHSKGH
jgi:hypothetical protein